MIRGSSGINHDIFIVFNFLWVFVIEKGQKRRENTFLSSKFDVFLCFYMHFLMYFCVRFDRFLFVFLFVCPALAQNNDFMPLWGIITLCVVGGVILIIIIIVIIWHCKRRKLDDKVFKERHHESTDSIGGENMYKINKYSV